MKRTIILSSTMLVMLLLTSCGLEKTSDLSEENSSTPQVNVSKDESIEKEEIVTQELTGVYTEYDENLIGNTETTVLFFHANWCPSCRAADTNILQEKIPEGITLLKTDYDSQTELKKKYKVVTQHTFVQIDAGGNEIKKWVGGNDIADIIDRVQ